MSAQPETVHQFLRLCLRGRWDAASLPAAREIARSGQIDWEAVCQAAQSQGLAPLLYKIVRKQGIVPPEVEKRLGKAYTDLARHNLFQFHELSSVLGGLAAAGIEAIVLKGAGLAETVYGNIAVRPMCDFDLLVRREDTAAALQTLEGMGYRVVPPPPAAHTKARTLHKEKGAMSTAVELHWNLFISPHYQRLLPMEWFWQTALPLELEGVPARVLGPEAQVLYLCGHMMVQHAGETSTRWLHDIAEVIVFYQEQIDWDTLLARAQACELVGAVQHILARLVEEWRAPIPPQVMAQVAALRPTQSEEQVSGWIAATRRSAAANFWADFAAAPGWGAKLRLAWRTLFPPAGFMRHIYRIPHPLLLPLFYLVRLLGGLRDVLASSGRSLKNK